MSSNFNNIHTEKAKNLLEFLHLVEKLKCILRHGWTSSGRQESVADHSWRLALIVIFCSHFTDQNINVEKTLKMALVHDIAEVITGDVPYFLAPEGSLEKIIKKKQEKEAIISITKTLEKSFGNELLQLWEEYESNQTYEAKIVKAVDKIEAQIQQNEADLSTWLDCERVDATEGYINRYCQFDTFLAALSDQVIQESKIIAKKITSLFG